MPLPPLFIRGKLSEVNLILSVVSYNRQRSHRHLQPALHPAELTTGGKWTYNRQCGHDYKLELQDLGVGQCTHLKKRWYGLFRSPVAAWFSSLDPIWAKISNFNSYERNLSKIHKFICLIEFGWSCYIVWQICFVRADRPSLIRN